MSFSPSTFRVPSSNWAVLAILVVCGLCVGCNDSQWMSTAGSDGGQGVSRANRMDKASRDHEPGPASSRTDNRFAPATEPSPAGYFVSKGTEPSSRFDRSSLGEPAPLASNDHRPPILAVDLLDHCEFGVPIGLFADKTLLMRRDGSIQYLTNTKIVNQTVLADRFQSIERNELAQQLYGEFGRRYAIKLEAPYLIVAQSNNMPAWSQRFRSMYHSFRLYTKTHGIPLREIEFPLVAIVLGSHQEFLRYAQSDGSKLPDHCVGYYSQKSNRIVLYESSDSHSQDTLETICHEATHQLAFNTGLHQRLAMTPLWVAEGFATMFESSKLSGLQSRDGGSYWPESRRLEWKAMTKDPESLYRLVENLVRSDVAFDRNSLQAYSVAWGMTTYLSQRRPQQFSQFLARIASLPPFEQYPAAQRTRDFHALFSKDTRMFAKSMVSFIESLD